VAEAQPQRPLKFMANDMTVPLPAGNMEIFAAFQFYWRAAKEKRRPPLPMAAVSCAWA
jgi:hypothetical protein